MIDIFSGSMLYSTAIPIGRRLPASARAVDITVRAAAVCKNLRRSIGVSDSRTLATLQANTLFFSVVREMGDIGHAWVFQLL
jgi:hypothetical protein